MTNSEIINNLAPCGLDCVRCARYEQGEISTHSSALLAKLGNFKAMAAKMSGFFAPFTQYDSFEETLKFFASASCGGCRAGGSKLPGCTANSCSKERGVDFCGECEEFPCEKNEYNPQLKERWLSNGEAIRKNGVEAFYKAQSEKPRY